MRPLHVSWSVFLPLVFAAACSSRSEGAPTTPVVCAPSPPVSGYDLTIETDDQPHRTRIDPATITTPLVVATGAGHAPYHLALHPATCGDRVDVAFVVTRLTGPEDVAAVFPFDDLARLGVERDPAAPPWVPSRPPEQIKGAREIVRGGEGVLGEGTWPDGERYAIRVAVR
jgi:hypothetical protein